MTKKIMPDPVRVILRMDNEEHVCTKMPIGWRDQSASWIFDFKNFGYGVKYTPDKFRFVKEDADFIRRCIDRHGISTAIDVIVQHRQNNWTFKDTWTGQTRFEDGYVNEIDFFEVNVVEGGLKRAIDKNGKTKFDMPFDEDSVDIEVTEGMRLYENVKYDINNILIFGEFNESAGIAFTIDRLILRINVENSNIFTNRLIFGNDPHIKQLKSDYNEDINVFVNLKFLINSMENIDKSQEIKIQCIRKPLGSLGPTTMPLEKIYPPDYFLTHNEINEFMLPLTITPALDYDYQYDFYLITYDKPELGEQFYWKYIYGDGNLDISFFGNTNTGQFNFKAYKAEKFGQKLLDRIFPNADFQIPFLQEMEQNENMQLFITSADAIRGIVPTDEQPHGALIKAQFSDFLENLGKLYSMGVQCSVKDNFYKIVKKTDIFKDVELLNLGKAKNVRIINTDDEWLYNNIKVGYEKQEYDYPLGRQEFANTLELDNELNIDSSTLDLVSKYRADYTGVHLLRYAYVNADKKDSKSDNDIFFILAFKNSYDNWQAKQGERVTDIAGMEGGGYFNILLSPKAMLINHARFFASILDKHAKILRYTSSTETMSALEYDDTELGHVVEKADLSIANAQPFFKPFIFQFDCIVPVSLSEIMGETPCGYFTFKYNNIIFKGFPIDIQGNLNRSEQTVRCVAHPDTPDNIQEILHKRLPNKLYK